MNLSSRSVLLMAFISGLSVANLYYCQPLTTLMKKSFDCTDGEISWIVSLCQIGYAFGMCFFISLGDLVERKKLILLFMILSVLSLIALSFASSLYLAYFSSFLIGMTTMTPHLTIPLVAALVAEKKRGQAVGTVLSGVALGLLLGRTFSGFVGPVIGWRLLYRLAAAMMGGAALVVYGVYPRFSARFQGSYIQLQKSIWTLVKTEPVLREAMFFGALMFAAFNAFWVNLIHLMELEQYQLGAPGVGMFALLGSTSIVMATLAGKLADRISPRKVVGLGIAAMAACFLVLILWGEVSLMAVTIGVILLDIGNPAGTVANQARIYSLAAAVSARSRLNAAYMTAYFVGGAFGSTVSSWAWTYAQWKGVCMVSLILVGICGAVYLRSPSR